MSLKNVGEPYRSLLRKLLELLSARLSDNLISVVVYGSVARGAAKKDSDIDLLIIIDSPPKGRMKRTRIISRNREAP